MTKQDLIKTFGSIELCARMLGISRQAVNQWPSTIKQHQEDRVVGACKRLGVPVQRVEKQSA